jgi:hypothetical protein
MTAFEIQRLEMSRKINLDLTVGIHDNHLDCKGLMLKDVETNKLTGIILQCGDGFTDFIHRLKSKTLKILQN